MSKTEHTLAAKADIGGKVLAALIPGVILVLVGSMLIAYRAYPLGSLLLFVGLCASGYGLYQIMQIRKVTSVTIACPFCEAVNELTVFPDDDFRCDGCNRDVPILDGAVAEAFQVRCGFCNALNYYSTKSTGLICEECEREIPIATDQENLSKKVFENYTVHDDNQPYDLVLTAAPDTEEMVSCLQHLLALNRNQVKQMLQEMPLTLLTGIPKKKAELLIAQIETHKGKADLQVSR